MADADFTIASNTWWTTGANAGTGDGSTFANRKAIPTGVGTGILNLTVNADVNLTLVLETASGAIVLGNNAVAAKTMTVYGGLYTVDSTNTAIHPGNTCAFRCAIGGTTGYKEGVKYLYGIVRVANIDWGQDSTLTATANGYFYIYGKPYFYNCTFKTTLAVYTIITIVSNGVLESCTVYITGNYAIWLQYGNLVLIKCIINTAGISMRITPSGTMDIVGGLTLTGGTSTVYLDANTIFPVQYYRCAYLKTVDVSAVALSGAVFSAYEATGGVDMPLSSGVTGATGLCKVLSPTIYNDSQWALQKLETYIRTTAGAMTWGTPTSTVTYGNYTHTFSKSGYVPQTQTHDFTDGADWGTVGTPIAITMVKPSAIPAPSNSQPLAVFSDAACTVETSTLQVGASGYVNGDVNLKSIGTDTRTATTTIKIHKKSDDSVMATLYNDSVVLTGGTTYNYKTSALFGNGTAYTFSTTGYDPGEYYVQVVTSGTDITTQTNTEYFVVAAVPTTYFQAEGGLWGDVSFVDPWKNICQVTAYPSTLTRYNFLISAKSMFVVPTGGVTVYLYDFAGTLVDTLWVSTTPLTLVGGWVYESLTSLKTSTLSFTTPATAGKYKLALEIYDPARPNDYLWAEEWIEVLTSATPPVISSPLFDDTTITDLQNLVATATASNTPTEAMIIFYSPGTSNVVYQTEMAITGSALAVTIPYGSIPIGTYSAGDIKIVASNASGLDTDESLSLTVSASTNVEPVLHVYNLLFDNWNAGNVTKPQMMKGGDVGGDKYLADGDVIKIYRSPSSTTRKSRGLGMTHEDTDDYVLIDINTLTSRAQLRLLEIEATRVFTSFRKSPGGGYSWIWSDKLDTRAEYADHFRQVYEIHLKKIGKAVST